MNRNFKKSTNVVDQLKWINDHRRADLAKNFLQKKASELNDLIPEINDIEVANCFANQAGTFLRIIAWNTERGRYWREATRLLTEHPILKNPDIVILGEIDLGMARSNNEHTTKELANGLNMNYAYAVEFLELTNGELEEREKYPGENEWGYHGNAILSKYPLTNLCLIRFPGIEKWYSNYQKRLGGRMALFAEAKIHNRSIRLVSTHLENLGDDPQLRRIQMKMILNECNHALHSSSTIIAGDFNSSPDELLFHDLKKAGFLIDECNEMDIPTQQILKEGQVSLAKNKIDYIILKALPVCADETSPKTVLAVSEDVKKHKMLSDHAIVTVKVRLS